MGCLLALAVGTGEPVRARYMCIIGITSDDRHTWYRHVDRSESCKHYSTISVFLQLNLHDSHSYSLILR